MAKTTVTKKLAQKTSISIREAESHLDAYVFPDEYPRWVPLRSHCPLILHQMFAHTTATLKEHSWAICWGWWQPFPQTRSGGRTLCYGSHWSTDILNQNKGDLQQSISCRNYLGGAPVTRKQEKGSAKRNWTP